jgi:hypothetical protein
MPFVQSSIRQRLVFLDSDYGLNPMAGYKEQELGNAIAHTKNVEANMLSNRLFKHHSGLLCQYCWQANKSLIHQHWELTCPANSSPANNTCPTLNANNGSETIFRESTSDPRNVGYLILAPELTVSGS